MSETPQMDRLVARFEKMKAEGLRDFKFTLDPTKPTGTAEELAAELNDVLDAVDAGEYTDMPPIGDSRRHGNCPKCGAPLTTIKGFWPAFETPHCAPCLLETPKP